MFLYYVGQATLPFPSLIYTPPLVNTGNKWGYVLLLDKRVDKKAKREDNMTLQYQPDRVFQNYGKKSNAKISMVIKTCLYQFCV